VKNCPKKKRKNKKELTYLIIRKGKLKKVSNKFFYISYLPIIK